jgi:adenosine deaminase
MPNILFCTLGASWAVIPEAYGFLAPERLPLYQHHPEYQVLSKLKADYALQAPDEIWVCTTKGSQTENSLAQLLSWLTYLSKPPILRIWQAADTDQLASLA